MTVTQAIRQEGRQRGRREGRREGRQEGRREGRREGRQERNWEIADSMLSKGFAPSLIQELSGVSAQELRQLEKEHARNNKR